MTVVRKPLRRVVAVALALAGAMAPGTPGCRGPAPERPAETQAARPATMPEAVPGLEEDDPGAAEVMVKGAYDRGERETYRHDPKHPAGTLQGGCRFTDCEGMDIPAEEIVPVAGETAVKDPRPGETDFYRNIGIKRPWSCENLRRRRQIWVVKRRERHGVIYIPCNVVVMLRDVKVGRRPPLTRPVLSVHQGLIGPGDDANGGGNDVQFCPLHERVQMTTWDRYPCDLVLTRQASGRVVFEGRVSYRRTSQTRLEGRVEPGHLAYKPQFVASDPLRDCGLHVLTCRRHPWQKAYLWVVQNPYVTTTVWAVYRNPLCNFKLDQVPPGRHTVEVWHPVFEPVKRTFEVEIEANEIKEVMIRFHPPKSWRSGHETSSTAPRPH